MSDDIVFDDPSELGQILESSKAPSVEIDHQEVVAQVQKKARDAQPLARSKAIPADHPGGHPLPHEPREQKFALGNKMLSKSEYDQYCQNQDPDVYNFLLKAQNLLRS